MGRVARKYTVTVRMKQMQFSVFRMPAGCSGPPLFIYYHPAHVFILSSLLPALLESLSLYPDDVFASFQNI